MGTIQNLRVVSAKRGGRMTGVAAATALALLMSAVVQPASARPKSALDSIPKVTATTGTDTGPGRLHSAGWGTRADRNTCSAVFVDGYPVFGEPIGHIPSNPIDITLWKRQRPSELTIEAYRALDVGGEPSGAPEEVPYELTQARHEGRAVWVARVSPVFIGRLLLTVDARWDDASRCSMGQQAAWSLSFQTGP